MFRSQKCWVAWKLSFIFLNPPSLYSFISIPTVLITNSFISFLTYHHLVTHYPFPFLSLISICMPRSKEVSDTEHTTVILRLWVCCHSVHALSRESHYTVMLQNWNNLWFLSSHWWICGKITTLTSVSQWPWLLVCLLFLSPPCGSREGPMSLLVCWSC